MKLDALLKRAKARKAHIVVNNILLERAEERGRVERMSILKSIIETGRATRDSYNVFRAIVRINEDRSSGEPLSDSDKLQIIAAYHFFHNERLNSYFNRVHDLLWRVFDEEGDTWNLLSLFRHSSFIWRLSGATTESKYLETLRLRYDAITRSNLLNVSRERNYFLARLRANADR